MSKHYTSRERRQRNLKYAAVILAAILLVSTGLFLIRIWENRQSQFPEFESGAPDANLRYKGDEYELKDENARSYPRKFPFALKSAKGSWLVDVEGNKPEGFDAVRFYDTALDAGVAYVAGEFFHPDRSGKNTMRLNFSFMTPEKISAGIELLAKLLSDEIL